VIQVRAKAPFPYFLAQVAVSGRDHTRMGNALLRLADALELAVLEHAQKLRLQFKRQLPDLVQKQRAFLGVLEITGFVGRGAGERALGVAEQCGLDQGRRDRGALSANHGLSLRQDMRCSELATTSLPLPDSPSIRAGKGESAYWLSWLLSFSSAGLFPMRSSPSAAPPSIPLP